MRKINFILLLIIAGSALAEEEITIERLDPAIDALIPEDAKIEILATGFAWAEGPLWIPDKEVLLFSDVPNNAILSWDGREISDFMKPSGYTGVAKYGREPGSNGLALDGQGRLICAEHGDRRISILTKNGGKMTLADRFDGKRFNSPNDVVVHSSGAIYFTDPIYGLPLGEVDPDREMDFCGVFRIDISGEVTLLTRELERPNGLAFSPDEKILYVANSHSSRAIIFAIEILEDGSCGKISEFFNTSGLKGEGAPDGLKVDSEGNLWATGPGGLLVISPQGKLLGRVLTKKATANVAFGGKNAKIVFLTADDSLVKFERN